MKPTQQHSLFLALVLGLCSLLSVRGLAQAGAGMKIGKKHEAYADSIRNSDYRWPFPIWGKRVSKKGFDMQYPYGVMVNGFFAKQDITISDLKVGFNSMEPVPLDFIQFGKVSASLQSVNARADLWLFPFMDVYAIGGEVFTKTNVEVNAPFHFKSEANFTGTIVGCGTTLAAGYHGFIFIGDINHTWTFIPEIEGSVQTTLISPRIGMNFPFKERPDRNIAIWVGATSIILNNTTEGTIQLSELSSDAPRPELENIKNGVSDWYNALPPAQKVIVKQIAEKLLDKLDGLDLKGATVSYSLKKRPTSYWSMCAGAQFQLSHHWQFRTEVGFLGGRQSVLISANYRWR